ncbi:IucA/IucC family protein [Thermostaphylospora chromogena]|uniref:Siderophore synthetase component n=1 Tax=Thermostaphylospora chromogena TaxID=35622 RepID=A0A1H1AX28_9ACTN|nr:IucA/IucC family protein [Thermostaphylospora chromogena]SDQ44203.1 Siderophore synthetase component [Thermostaphylospora chromogena]
MDGPDQLGSPVAVAEDATLAALLRCCARELAAVGATGPYLTLRLAGTAIRARARGGLALRFTGRPEYRDDRHGWRPLTVEHLVHLIDTALRGDGGGNDEFAAQVTAGREAMATLLKARADATPPADPWLASEQALVLGHPFHPTPKARGGTGWLPYSPEAHATFPLRLLAVREDLLAGDGDTAVLDGLGRPPDGYALLPAHPWQLDLLRTELAAPLRDRLLVDLGPSRTPVTPTSSVRTVYDPATGTCLKFSLDVRITNCVRKNAWYELAGAVALTTHLTPVFDDLAARFPGTRWLPEPGYRSAALGTRLLEGLGVIVRTGPWSVTSPGVTPVLAGALAAGAMPAACRARVVADPLRWWTAYVARVAPPVLDAYFRHRVVLEPHLQNVLVGLDDDGMPAEVVFRDMEGTKLLPGHPLPEEISGPLTYSAEQGWNRVVYCLIVNHLVEIAATVGETAAQPPPEAELWRAARRILDDYAAACGRPARLADLLAGAPVPAKANLSVRWARSPDRAAGYVALPNPLAPEGPPPLPARSEPPAPRRAVPRAGTPGDTTR